MRAILEGATINECKKDESALRSVNVIATCLATISLLGGSLMSAQDAAPSITRSLRALANESAAVSPHVTTIEQGATSPATANNPKSYHGSVGPYVPLNVLWRIRTGGGDRTITADPNERDSFPLEGAIFYVPIKNHPALGTQPLYRLFNGSDHMVSIDPNEGAAQGYHVEEILGYPFTAQQPGTSELIRTFNPTTGHHSLRNSTGVETEQGYVDEPLGVFGYPRYYNQSTRLLSLSGGGITLDSNLVAGGALWHWTWNGVQVINNWDFGRQIQTDIFPPDFANPTEAGDTWSTYSSRAAINHGSPWGWRRMMG